MFGLTVARGTVVACDDTKFHYIVFNNQIYYERNIIIIIIMRNIS